MIKIRARSKLAGAKKGSDEKPREEHDFLWKRRKLEGRTDRYVKS